MSAYKMIELNLTVDLSNGPSQVLHNYGSGGRLDESMAYAILKLIEEGRIEECAYSADDWISPCFPKAKPGRKFEVIAVPKST